MNIPLTNERQKVGNNTSVLHHLFSSSNRNIVQKIDKYDSRTCGIEIMPYNMEMIVHVHEIY